MNAYIKSKKTNCKNCYKCIRHCEVKSLCFSNNQASIISDDCIYCGECYLICPQNVKSIESDTSKVRQLLKDEQVIASIAPSFHALSNTSYAQLKTQLKAIGFYDVEETAIGAAFVKTKYEEKCDEHTKDVMITSSCYSVNLLIQKYYPEVVPNLIDVISPMEAHARFIKQQYPKAKVVFIGPCISKKAEIENENSAVDIVLTFDELEEFIHLEEGLSSKQDAGIITRRFPTSGGILSTMRKNENYTYIAIDGIQNCMQTLADIKDKKIQNCFIEMSLCTKSCVGGPIMRKRKISPLASTITISKQPVIENKEELPNIDFDRTFEMKGKPQLHIEDEMIEEVLKKIGKTTKEHELNCGSCGYNTCREKAIAVMQQKANLEMCMPYLKDKAESFSDNIIKNTPNGIIVLNEDFEIQQMNDAACNILNLNNSYDVVGEQVIRILDPKVIMDTYLDKKNTYDKKLYLADCDKHINLSVIYDQSYHILICIMRDITHVTRAKKERDRLRVSTIAITDEIVEKQMRSVQEIASLLGETTAETKVAMSKLKELLHNE